LENIAPSGHDLGPNQLENERKEELAFRLVPRYYSGRLKAHSTLNL
jgi:hypothetical protein